MASAAVGRKVYFLEAETTFSDVDSEADDAMTPVMEADEDAEMSESRSSPVAVVADTEDVDIEDSDLYDTDCEEGKVWPVLVLEECIIFVRIGWQLDAYYSWFIQTTR